MAEFSGFDPVLAAEKMADAPQANAGGSGPAEERAPAKRRFRAAATGAVLSPDQARRQSQITNAAFLALGQAKAIAFLNSHDEGLGGRPLDLAVASAEGLAAVEARLHRKQSS